MIEPVFVDLAHRFPLPIWNRRILSRESLIQKIESLRQRTGAWKETIGKMEQEQKQMFKMASHIRGNQKMVNQQQEAFQRCQYELDQQMIQIKQDHAHIRLSHHSLGEKERAISLQVIKIKENQRIWEEKEEAIEQKQQSVDQYAALIRQNLVCIQETLEQSRQKLKEIQQKVLKVEKEHVEIRENIQTIEETKGAIQQHLSRLPIKQKARSSAWLERIQDLCLWILVRVCHQMIQIYQCLAEIHN